MAYRTINGRRYHADRGNASYWGANDEAQNESVELLYYAINDNQGGLYMAPLDEKKTAKCLDIGTGVGMWAM